MALCRVLGVTYLASCVILTTAIASAESNSPGKGKNHTTSVAFNNSMLSGTSSGGRQSGSLAPIATSTNNDLVSQVHLPLPISSPSDTGIASQTLRSRTTESSQNLPQATALKTSPHNANTSTKLPASSDQSVSAQSLGSLHASVFSSGSSVTDKDSNQASSLLSSAGSTLGLSQAISVASASGIRNFENSTVLSATQGSARNTPQGWPGTSSTHYVLPSTTSYLSNSSSKATASISGQMSRPTASLTANLPGHMFNLQYFSNTSSMSTKTNSSSIFLTTPNNSSLSYSATRNLTVNTTSPDSPTIRNLTIANITLTTPSLGNTTISPGLSSNLSISNSTLANLALSGISMNNGTIGNLTVQNSTFIASLKNATSVSNLTINNITLATGTPKRPWFLNGPNASSAIAHLWKPIHPTLKTQGGAVGYQLLTTEANVQCSGVITKDIQRLTKTIITTTWLDETVTIFGNVTTPLPIFISPIAPCSTSYLPFKPNKPGGPGVDTSTLLVTKKSPVVIRAPQTVGPLFNIPTTSAETAPAQPAADSNHGNVPNTEHEPSQGEDSGRPNQAQSGSNGQSSPQSSGNDLNPGTAPLQQEYPEAASSSSSDSGNNFSPQQGSGNNENQPPGSNVQQPGQGHSSGGSGKGESEGQSPEVGGQASNGGKSPGGAVQGSSGGTSPGNENVPSLGNQPSGDSDQASHRTPGSVGNGGGSNGGQNDHTDDEAASGGQTSGNDNAKPNPGHLAGVTSQNNNYEPTPAEGQTQGGAQNIGNGGSSESSGAQENGSSSNPTADVSPSNEQSNSKGKGTSLQSSNSESSNSNGLDTSIQNEGTSDADSSAAQIIPNVVNVDNVPVSMGGSVVVVGSQTVAIGSSPTTVMANGQPIAVQSTRIVGPGATVPIEAAITGAPAASTTINGVSIVLHPDDVMIGSQSFTHDSTPAFAVYNGQTYSWDARQLIGPGGKMISFPSATSGAPQITAGGQVFSVHSSTLQASGTNISIPNSPKASPFLYKDRTFSVNPSQLIAPERSITIPQASQPTPFVYAGQTFSVDSSRFIAPSATLPISSGVGTVRYGADVITIDHTRVTCPTSVITLTNAPLGDTAVPPSAITTGGATFSIGPQAAVVGSSTYSFLPGQTPAVLTAGDQKVTLRPGGVHFSDVNIPAPTGPVSYSIVTEGGLTFSAAPSAVILGSHTYDIGPTAAPAQIVDDGQTIRIGTQGIVFASTTIPLPKAPSNYATITEGDLTFSVAPSEAVVKGSTFAIGPHMPATMVLEGQTVSIGPTGIHFPGTTVAIPRLTSQETPLAVTADGLTFSVGPTNAYIGGTEYAIGSGAVAKTVMVSSKTISLGTNGIVLPSTTIAPEQTPSAITADGLTFSADATEAIINGTAYAIGSEAIAKTIVVGSETIGLGTKGILLPSTTIRPWATETQGSPSSSYRGGTINGSSPTAVATTVAPPPTGLPGTSPETPKSDVHHGAAFLHKPPDTLVLASTVGLMSLSILALM
ncbi:hypothetical protein ACLMJK_003618 [Lecanora helva]